MCLSFKNPLCPLSKVVLKLIETNPPSLRMCLTIDLAKDERKMFAKLMNTSLPSALHVFDSPPGVHGRKTLSPKDKLFGFVCRVEGGQNIASQQLLIIRRLNVI